MSEQAQPVTQQLNLLVFFDAEDIEYLRELQAEQWLEQQKSIDLRALAKACVKESRLARAMSKRAEASCNTK